jgi:hypothetical protein
MVRILFFICFSSLGFFFSDEVFLVKRFVVIAATIHATHTVLPLFPFCEMKNPPTDGCVFAVEISYDPASTAAPAVLIPSPS